MDQETLRRIEALEREVRTLRAELDALQQPLTAAPKNKKREWLALDKEKVEQAPPRERTLVEPIAQPESLQTQITLEEQTQPVEPPQARPPRSLEETFTRALPRIFMVILALGVLWGLKLVSDYGILSDGVKVMLGYVLSIGLAMGAFVMEKREKGSRLVALSLYGGAFIVGILVTAAGAILYEVLGLYTALIIALVYIGYGVAVSYVKGNEALTVLVVFTSLLLPYLLEYMAFSAVIIGVFVVVLFAVVQLVIFKHQQKIALYVGLLFSVLSIAIVSGFNMEQHVFFALAVSVLYAVFLVSFMRLHVEKVVHAAALFSLTLFVVGVINGLLFVTEVEILLLLALVGAMLSFAAYKAKGQALLFDVLATLVGLVLLNFLAHLNVADEVIVVLALCVAFAGLMLGLKHHIPFMKVVYALSFSLLGTYVLIVYDVQPFWSVMHVALVVVIVMLVALSYVMYRQYAGAERKDMTLLASDFLPVIVYIVSLLYIWKLDVAYMPQAFATYAVYAAMIVLLLVSLLLPKRIIGPALVPFTSLFYLFSAVLLYTRGWVPDVALTWSFGLRIVYLLVLWAILLDVWKKGAIYRQYDRAFTTYIGPFTASTLVVTVVAVFSLTSSAHWHELLGWSGAVIINTVTVFALASLALFLAARREVREVKLVGIGLLFFGIVKMIFFDLSALDLLIRSILFIVVGAIGLFISNKLLAKGKETDGA